MRASRSKGTAFWRSLLIVFVPLFAISPLSIPTLGQQKTQSQSKSTIQIPSPLAPAAKPQSAQTQRKPAGSQPSPLKTSIQPQTTLVMPSAPKKAVQGETALSVNQQQIGTSAQSTISLSPRISGQIPKGLQRTIPAEQLQPAASVPLKRGSIGPANSFVSNANPAPVTRASIQSPGCSYGDNCVLYLRDCLHAKMPGKDLTSWQQKQAAINNSNPNAPKVGDIAMIYISSGPYAQNGHVAVVKSVNNNGTITIQEAHYPTTGFETRTGTPAQLNIAGYYDGTK